MRRMVRLALYSSALLLLGLETNGMNDNLPQNPYKRGTGGHNVPPFYPNPYPDNYDDDLDEVPQNFHEQNGSGLNNIPNMPPFYPNPYPDNYDGDGSDKVSQNPYKQNGSRPNIPDTSSSCPNPYLYDYDDNLDKVIFIPPQLNQQQTVNINDGAGSLYSNYQSPFSMPEVLDNNNNDNNNDNDNSNWGIYTETPSNSQDNLYQQPTVNDSYDEYKNMNQSCEANIPQMDMETVQAHLISIESEINECERELNDMLVMLQAIDDGDDASVQQLIPQIEELGGQINNCREIRNLLQKRKQELVNQMSLKDQMIFKTQETLSDTQSDQRTDETIDDTFQKIEREINRIGKQIEREVRRVRDDFIEQVGKPAEKEVQNFRDGTVIPVLKNVKRFLKKL